MTDGPTAARAGHAGAPEATEAGAPGATEAGAPEAAEVGAPEAAEAGAPGATEAGREALGHGVGHGKIILVGEHAAVFGHPAVAATLAARIAVSVRPGDGRITAPGPAGPARVGDGSRIAEGLAALAGVLGPHVRQAMGRIDVVCEGDLPSGAGLGSSAAWAVATARALRLADAAGAFGKAGAGPGTIDARAEAATDARAEAAIDARAEAAIARVRAAADAAETVFHGRASGVDAATAIEAPGFVGTFTRATGLRALTVRQPLTLCVGLTGVAHDTARLVGHVGRLVARTPSAAATVEVLGGLAADVETALARGDVDELGRILDVGHGLLAALGVSSPALERLVHGARAAGAIGAKLTGAGGGGAVIALGPGRERAILERWRADGFTAFTTTLGTTGATTAQPPGRAA